MAHSDNDPTHSSSGEEEEDGSSEEISDSESEPEKSTPSSTPVTTKKPSASSSSKQTTRPSIPAPSVSSSEGDESGSESESDSDSPPKSSAKPDPAIKPISSKPMEIPPPKAVTKPRSKPAAPASPPPAAKSATKAKRPASVPVTETVESKKAKKKGDEAEDGGDAAKKTNGDDPKKLFQRLWSEEDEVVILKGMSDYTAKKKADPIADMNAFHDFIKKSLHVDVSKTQLSDKVRRLKKKYVNNFKKEKTGKERTFSKSHEQLCYNLSKKIWGGSSSSNGGEDENAKVDNNVKSSGTAKKYQIQKNGTVSAALPSEVDGADGHKEVVAMEVDANVQSVEPVLSGGSIALRDSADQMIRNGWKLVSESKRSEWEKKSKKLMVEEVELYSKRLELMHEQVKLVSEAMKSAAQE